MDGDRSNGAIRPPARLLRHARQIRDAFRRLHIRQPVKRRVPRVDDAIGREGLNPGPSVSFRARSINCLAAPCPCSERSISRFKFLSVSAVYIETSRSELLSRRVESACTMTRFMSVLVSLG